LQLGSQAFANTFIEGGPVVDGVIPAILLGVPTFYLFWGSQEQVG
jgi:hypothetical protein